MCKIIDFIGDLKTRCRFNRHTLSIEVGVGKKPLFSPVFTHFLWFGYVIKNYLIGVGGGTRTEIKGFYKTHYSIITHQLPRKNRFITHGRQ